MFKIQSNVKVPTHCSFKSNVKQYTYPFIRMKVGQSFKFPITDRYRVTAAAHAPGVKKKLPRAKFVSRKIDENSGRIWRVR